MIVGWNEVWGAAWLTLRVAAGATLLGALVGVPLGLALAQRRRGASRPFVRALVYALYGLPPVLAGLVVYLLLSRDGPLGFLGLLFTPAAMTLAEALLAAPLVAGVTLAAVAELPAPVLETVRASGAPPLLRARTLLREARAGVLAGVMVGFGRALAEVAAALIVGGNIRFETRTLGTAILQSVSEGDYSGAIALGGVLLALALLSFLVLARLQGLEDA